MGKTTHSLRKVENRDGHTIYINLDQIIWIRPMPTTDLCEVQFASCPQTRHFKVEALKDLFEELEGSAL